MFLANTNASLKNMEIQVGQLALSMQNKSRDSFPSDTKKDPKDCMAITLRSGRGIQKRKEDDEKIIAEKEGEEEIGKESYHNSLELTEERRKSMVQ